MSNQTRAWKYIFVIASVLALLLVVVPGRLASFDEVFFKCAGRHWAATGSFSAPEIVGRVDVKPGLDVIYFAQPPLYTFVFGLYTKLVGFGPHRCILFDALIHLLLAAATACLAGRVFKVPAHYAYAVGLLVLPLGTQGRPDELAMCLALAGMLAWTLDLAPGYRALLSGAAFGLCGATSIGACLFLSPLALLVAHHQGVLTLRTASRAVISGLVVGLLCVAPILVSHPDAYRQLLAHASDQSPQLGVFSQQAPAAAKQIPNGHNFLKSVLRASLDGTLFALRFYSSFVALLIGAFLVTALCIPAMPAEGSRVCKQSAVAALAGILAIWLILPGKATYLWFFVPWLLSLSAIVLVRSYSALRRGTRALVAFAIMFFFGIGFVQYAKDTLVMLTLPKEQSFYWNMARVRELVPPGARVVTAEYWWALADKCQVVDPNLSHPVPLNADYFIKTGNGTGRPGRPVPFPPYFDDFASENHFVVLEDDLNRKPFTIAGVRITHSGWGFGPYILARSSDRMVGRQLPAGDLPQ